MQEKIKATMYFKNEHFGNIVKKEIYLLEFGTWEYAQYKNAPFVIFKEPNGRITKEFTGCYHPCLVILKGWGHPDSDSLFSVAVKEENGVIVKTSKYMSFDEKYQTDFDELIDKYLTTTKSVKIIADYRYTKGFDSLNRVLKSEVKA